MILIEKGPEPKSLKDAQSLTLENVGIFQLHGAKTSVSSSAPPAKSRPPEVIYITSAYREHDVKEALIRSHWGKCAFCETRVIASSHGDVEHFRPKAEFIGDGDTDKGLGYFWLAYDWTNLLLSCQVCNQAYKKTYFGMMPEVDGLIPRSVRITPGNSVSSGQERPVLIDPSLENPRALIRVHPDTGVIEARSSGQFFIDSSRVGKVVMALGLNRPELVAQRRFHMTFLRSLFLLVCERLLADAEMQKCLTHLRDGLQALTQASQFGQAQQIQQELNQFCNDTIHHLEGAQPVSLEALKWLLFSVTPEAEFTALAQDCLLEWTQAAVTAQQSVKGTSHSTNVSSPSQYSTTVNDSNWPPLGLPDVNAYRKSLMEAIQAYGERHKDELKEFMAAIRDHLYNQVNLLIARISTFPQLNPSQEEATDAIFEWEMELDSLEGALLEIEQSTTLSFHKDAKQNVAALHKTLSDELEALRRSKLSNIDFRIQQLSQQGQQLAQSRQQIDSQWQICCNVVRTARTTLQELLNKSQQTGAAQMEQDTPNAFPLDPIFNDIEPLVALSRQFQRWIQPCVGDLNQFWASATGGVRTNVCLGVKDQQHYLSLVQARQQLQPDVVEQSCQTLRSMLTEADSLSAAIDDADCSRSSWRYLWVQQLRNALIDSTEAIDKAAQSIVEPLLNVSDPQPTFDDPWIGPGLGYQPALPQPIQWFCPSAAADLEDWFKRNNKNGVISGKQKQQTWQNKQDKEKEMRVALNKLRRLAASEAVWGVHDGFYDDLENVHLKGAVFPASKVNLLDLAKKNKAPDEILKALDAIPEYDYGNIGELFGEVVPVYA